MKNTFIGTPMERREDLRLLRGRGTFSDDVNADRQLHAVILRSPVARGTIRTIDIRSKSGKSNGKGEGGLS